MDSPWFDRHVLDVQDPRLAELAHACLAAPPDAYATAGCQLSEFERLVFEAVRKALRRETERLGIERRLPPDDLIHVLEDAEFAAKLGMTFGGKSIYRHAYLRRNRPPGIFLHDASHELSHGIAYLTVEFLQAGRADEPDLLMRARRNGLTVNAFRDAGVWMAYNGLNEGVTDMLAHRAAVRVAVDGDISLSSDQRQEAAQYWSYFPAVCVVAALIHRLGPSFGRPEDARDQLLRDYLTGSTVFLRALNRFRPGAAKILAAMATDTDSAVETAARLDLPEALDRMAEAGALC